MYGRGTLLGVVGALLLIAVVALPCGAEETLPKVMMMEFHESPSEQSGLYKAIRAQLSSMPLLLHHVGFTGQDSLAGPPVDTARRLATEQGASLVFWIEEKETCDVYFFIPDSQGGRIRRRTLDLDLSSPSSRFEVIAIAVASMVEGLLASNQIPPVPVFRPPTPEPTPPPETPISENGHRFEIFAGYAGSFFAKDAVMHGGKFAVGFLPIRHLIITASFAHSFPFEIAGPKLRLTIISRIVGVSAAGRWVRDPFDLRLGVSWSIDIRSFSTEVIAENLAPFPGGTKGVQSVMPFFSATWIVTERLGLTGSMGAALGINDTQYEVARPDGADEPTSTPVMTPFVAKLTYQLGIIIFI